jgi:hypothetical protein
MCGDRYFFIIKGDLMRLVESTAGYSQRQRPTRTKLTPEQKRYIGKSAARGVGYVLGSILMFFVLFIVAIFQLAMKS